MTKPKTDMERFLESAFIPGGVTGERPGVKTWTYRPSMTVSVSGGRGIRIALILLWESIGAAIRRTSVTFEIGDDSPPFTIERGDS